MISRRMRTWAKKAQERLDAAGARFVGEWQGEHGPLTVICSEGHQFDTTWRRVVSCLNRSGMVGCPECSKEAKAAFHRADEDDIRQELAEQGFTLHSPYKNIHSHLQITCSNGHSLTCAIRDWRKAEVKCRQCRADRVHKEFEAAGFTVVTPFTGPTISMDVICPSGHKSSLKYEVWSRPKKPGYNGCNLCKPTRHGQDRALTQEQVEFIAQEKGFTILEPYKGNHHRILMSCDRGHVFRAAFSNFRHSKFGCKRCYEDARRPTPEQEISNKIGQQISTRIGQELAKKKRGCRKKGWKSRPWANQKAQEILKEHGARPDGFHLDHIVPCSFFDFRDEEQVKLCWSIFNLRWMEASKNISRGNRLTSEEVESFSPQLKGLLLKAKFTPDSLIKAAQEHSESHR